MFVCESIIIVSGIVQFFIVDDFSGLTRLVLSIFGDFSVVVLILVIGLVFSVTGVLPL